MIVFLDVTLAPGIAFNLFLLGVSYEEVSSCFGHCKATGISIKSFSLGSSVPLSSSFT
jgi:hypothetical protein